MEEILKQELFKNALDKLESPWKNLTVKDVAKDLKMGENLANQLFKRKDFPSVNIGRTKTISAIAYALWNIQNETESLSELNSSEKLQYLKNKHYSLEELEEEI